MLGPVRPFRLAVLNADNLDAVRSSHISEGDTEKSLMATIWLVRSVFRSFEVEDLSLTAKIRAPLSFARDFHQFRRCARSFGGLLNGASQYMYAKTSTFGQHLTQFRIFSHDHLPRNCWISNWPSSLVPFCIRSCSFCSISHADWIRYFTRSSTVLFLNWSDVGGRFNLSARSW